MKTIVTRIALLFALAFFFELANAAEPTVAANSVNSPSVEQTLMHQINKCIAFPLEGDQDRMYGVVEVDLVVDSDGRLVILDADPENRELRDYVVRKLARIRIRPNASGLWNNSHIRFTFLPEA